MTLRRIAATAVALAFAALTLPGVAAAAEKAPAGKVNVNTATVEQLTAVPGIGPTLAARIVEHRQKSGPFRSTADLLNVKGIGEKSLARIEGHLTLAEPAKAAAK
jgi:competence protein ComEA